MNYKESKEILEAVKKAEKIVLFCHENPDADSIISCLLMGKVLALMDKEVEIFSLDKINKKNRSLDSENLIKVTDLDKIDLSKYDLLFALDVSDIKRLGIGSPSEFSGTIINIDHHYSSDFADVVLFERDAGSTCSILYYLFKDWEIRLEKKDINMILLGIVIDTDIFRFPYPSSKIFKRVTELIDEGGDYEKAVYFADRCYDLDELKFWSEAISRIKVDENHRFAYVAIPYEVVKKYSNQSIGSRQLSDHFLRNINGTNYGLVILETKENLAKVSIRTRTPGFYVNKLLQKLGGGGHLTGGGATVKAENFDSAVDKVLQEARKFSKEHAKKYEQTS